MKAWKSLHRQAPLFAFFTCLLGCTADFSVSDFGDREQVADLHLVGDATLAMGFCYDYTVFVNMDYTCLQLPLPEDPYHRTPPRESMKQAPICQEHWQPECEKVCAEQDNLITAISLACIRSFVEQHISPPDDVGLFELTDVPFLDVDIIEDAGFVLNNLTDLVETGECSLHNSAMLYLESLDSSLDNFVTGVHGELWKHTFDAAQPFLKLFSDFADESCPASMDLTGLDDVMYNFAVAIEGVLNSNCSLSRYERACIGRCMAYESYITNEQLRLVQAEGAGQWLPLWQLLPPGLPMMGAYGVNERDLGRNGYNITAENEKAPFQCTALHHPDGWEDILVENINDFYRTFVHNNSNETTYRLPDDINATEAPIMDALSDEMYEEFLSVMLSPYEEDRVLERLPKGIIDVSALARELYTYFEASTNARWFGAEETLYFNRSTEYLARQGVIDKDELREHAVDQFETCTGSCKCYCHHECGCAADETTKECIGDIKRKHILDEDRIPITDHPTRQRNYTYWDGDAGVRFRLYDEEQRRKLQCLLTCTDMCVNMCECELGCSNVCTDGSCPSTLKTNTTVEFFEDIEVDETEDTSTLKSVFDDDYIYSSDDIRERGTSPGLQKQANEEEEIIYNYYRYPHNNSGDLYQTRNRTFGYYRFLDTFMNHVFGERLALDNYYLMWPLNGNDTDVVNAARFIAKVAAANTEYYNPSDIFGDYQDDTKFDQDVAGLIHNFLYLPTNNMSAFRPSVAVEGIPEVGVQLVINNTDVAMDGNHSAFHAWACFNAIQKAVEVYNFSNYLSVANLTLYTEGDVWTYVTTHEQFDDEPIEYMSLEPTNEPPSLDAAYAALWDSLRGTDDEREGYTLDYTHPEGSARFRPELMPEEVQLHSVMPRALLPDYEVYDMHMPYKQYPDCLKACHHMSCNRNVTKHPIYYNLDFVQNVSSKLKERACSRQCSHACNYQCQRQCRSMPDKPTDELNVFAPYTEFRVDDWYGFLPDGTVSADEFCT